MGRRRTPQSPSETAGAGWRGLAPFLLAALVVPSVWGAWTILLDEADLTSTADAARVVGTPTDIVRYHNGTAPVYLVEVAETDATSRAPGPPSGGSIQVRFPATTPGADDMARTRTPLWIALVPDPTSGNASSTAWLGTDARAGRLWGLQRQIGAGAAISVVPSLAAAALLGFAFDATRTRRTPALVPDGLAIGAGVLWASLVAGGAAGFGPTFPADDGGVAHVGALTIVVAGLATLLALVAQPVSPRAGGTTATLVGVGGLVAPALGLVGLWGHPVGPEGALWNLNAFVFSFVVLAGLGLVAVRFLGLRAVRWIAAALLVGPLLWAMTTADLRVFAWMAAPAVLALAIDLVQPRIVQPLVTRWLAD